MVHASFLRQPSHHSSMNFPRLIAPGLVLGALLLASCDSTWHTDYVYAGSGYNGSYASVGWSNARYDALGYPIYGYDDGRPVYGYSAAGLPIFSFSALTSYCYVPNWGPASWYCGHWHYPRHVHRRPLPPRYPHHHHPGLRPPANHPHNFPPGQRPNHRPSGRPDSLHRPGNALPIMPGGSHAGLPGNRPGAWPGQRPHGSPESRPEHGRPGHARPTPGGTNRPGNRPHVGGRPSGHDPALRPDTPRPSQGSGVHQNRPSSGGSANVTRPSRPNRPGHATDRPSSRPPVARPSETIGNAPIARPALPSARPSSPSISAPRPSAPRPATPSFSSPRPSGSPASFRPSLNRPSGPGASSNRPGGAGSSPRPRGRR